MWVVTWSVRQLCADINYHRYVKHHYSLYETAVWMNCEVRRGVFCDLTELEMRGKVASWTHVIIHQNITFVMEIMTYCIYVFRKGAWQFESCHFTTHLTTHVTTDFIIHSKSTFFKGIMMCCIAVIFDVGAQLGRLLTSRIPSRLTNKSSTKSRLSTSLTKYLHFAFMSETTFRRLRLLRASDVTTRLQNINITLYVFHFLESCCELNEMKQV